MVRKIWKILAIISFIILGLPPLFTLIETQDSANLPIHLLPVYQYPFIGRHLPVVLFWIAAACLLLLLGLIFAVAVYPSYRDTLKIIRPEGKLVIQKKAIEHVVSNLLQESSDIQVVKITVHFKKNKIVIKISGNLLPTSDIVRKKATLSNNIQSSLTTLFGVGEDIETTVIIQNYENPTKKNNRMRVI